MFRSSWWGSEESARFSRLRTTDEVEEDDTGQPKSKSPGNRLIDRIPGLSQEDAREEETKQLSKVFQSAIELENSTDPRKRRYSVFFASTYHACEQMQAGILRIHLVLKFYYHMDMLEYVGVSDEYIEAAKKAPKGKLIARERRSHHAWFPYCIFNALSEEPITWTVTKDKKNRGWNL